MPYKTTVQLKTGEPFHTISATVPQALSDKDAALHVYNNVWKVVITEVNEHGYRVVGSELVYSYLNGMHSPKFEAAEHMEPMPDPEPIKVRLRCGNIQPGLYSGQLEPQQDGTFELVHVTPVLKTVAPYIDQITTQETDA